MTEFHTLPSIGGEPSWIDDWNDKAERRARECEPASVPSLEHLTIKDYHNVYEPSDDTFLLLDGLHYEIKRGNLSSVKSTLEIGCGTGVPTIYLAMELKKLNRTSAMQWVTDVNPVALQVTKRTSIANETSRFLDYVQCDLASPLLKRLREAVDVILFNPPYVPTPDNEVGTNGIEASWAGGLNGRRVIDRALNQLSELLSSQGVAYMITVDDNFPHEICLLCKTLGLDMKPLVRRRARNEYLTVQKITRIRKQSDESNSNEMTSS